MAEFSDKEIIKKIKNGEIDFYAYIVKRYSDLIYQYIKARLFDKEEADDLVQNVFISFYKVIKKFDEKKSIKPYLLQIAKNELKMYYRSYKKTFPLDEKIVFEDKDEELTIDDIKQLNNQEKKIFKYMNEGYSYKEIARLVKKPLNTIKSIIRRARIKIKKTL